MTDDLTASQQDNRQVLTRWLGDIGLGGLEGDVMNWIVANRSPEWIKTEVIKTPTFQQEFPEYDAAIKAGNPMTPVQILSYRNNVSNMFKNAGLPAGFYDQRDDFVDLISKRLSPEELQTRVEQGYVRVAGAPQEVKDVFNQYFGVQGDNYLATFFLDPEKGGKFLQDAATQAEIGGAGSQYGFNLTQTQAERYQQMGISGQQSRQAFQQAYQLNPLAEESVSETTDLTKQDLAEGALAGGEAESRAQRRQQERSAAFRGGGGGASQGRQGLGSGAAR